MKVTFRFAIPLLFSLTLPAQRPWQQITVPPVREAAANFKTPPREYEPSLAHEWRESPGEDVSIWTRPGQWSVRRERRVGSRLKPSTLTEQLALASSRWRRRRNAA